VNNSVVVAWIEAAAGDRMDTSHRSLEAYFDAGSINMSNNQGSSLDVQQASLEASATAPRPCAFYSARMSAGGADESGGICHRCLLNPGKSHGPDGEEIGLSLCTMARQGTCQAQRRAKFARLHAKVTQMHAAAEAAAR
jgi:hypothetical protein